MDNFGQRLKKLRKSKGLTQTDLANILHLSDKSSISRYERNHNNPPIDVIKKMSEVLDVSVNYLLKGIENESNSKLQNINENEMIKIPVIGEIRGGQPILTNENIIDYEYIHQGELVVGNEYFYLQVKGDSMINARIFEKDRVLIKKQDFIENDGDIMAVRVNGDEATLKRVYRQKNGLLLQAENPNYAPMFYPIEDIENGYVGIIGKAIEVKIKL